MEDLVSGRCVRDTSCRGSTLPAAPKQGGAKEQTAGGQEDRETTADDGGRCYALQPVSDLGGAARGAVARLASIV